MKKRIEWFVFLSFLLMGVACSDDPADPKPIEEPDPCENSPVINDVAVENTHCGGNTGSIRVEAVGENGSLKYSLDGTSFQESNQFTEMAAGTYTLTVQDQENCQVQQEVKIENSAGTLAGTVTANTNAGCGTNEGSITLNASGGEGEYTFSINGENFQTNASFEGLGTGKYTAYVRDANGCEAIVPVTLISGISFQTTIAPIIEKNCAISGCHVAGTSKPDFNDFSVVKNYAGAIKGETQSGTMPPPSSGKSLTNEQIEAIACWVNDGAMEN